MQKKPSIFLKRLFIKNGPPIHLIWFLTSRCNLKCEHCFYHRQISSCKDELSLSEIRQAIYNLPPLLSVSLTGGEPFLRGDLPEIAAFLISRKIAKNIVLYSNGFATSRILADMEKILSVSADVIISLGISIDGCEETHDRYRNMQGSYKNACATITGLKQLQSIFPNFNVGIGVTLHAGNQGIILELLKDIYAEFGLVPGLTLIRGNPKSPELKAVDAATYKKAVNMLATYQRACGFKSLAEAFVRERVRLGQKLACGTYVNQSRSYACYAGSLMAVIYENGDVYPCEMLDESCFGNLRGYAYDLKEIWESEKAEDVRKVIRTRKCHCTYECQYSCNTLYNLKYFPHFVIAALKYVFSTWL